MQTDRGLPMSLHIDPSLNSGFLPMDLEIERYPLPGLSNSFHEALSLRTLQAHLDPEAQSHPSNSTVRNLERSMINSIIKDDQVDFLCFSKHLMHGSAVDHPTIAKMLHVCCAYDSVNCATSLLNGDLGVAPQVNEASEGGMSPLHKAAAQHSSRCVEMLLKRHARTDLRTGDGRAALPLQLSLSFTSVGVIWNPEEQSIEALVVKLSEKDLTTVKLLVLGEDRREINEVAHATAIGGCVVELATLLVVAAEKVNNSIVEIHDAALGSNEKITVYECVIREALALGSSRAQKSSSTCYDGNCASTNIDSASKRRLLLCQIELLQLFGAISQTGGVVEGKKPSPLIRASQAADVEVVTLLLKTSIDVNDVDAHGNSALLCCLNTSKGSCPQQIKSMCLLLNHGANVRQKDNSGQTALHIAAANGNLDALKILISEDPPGINSKTEMKETPLFFAVRNDHQECVEILLQSGASAEVFNLQKERPVDLAESQEMRSILALCQKIPKNHGFPSPQKYSTWALEIEVNSETQDKMLACISHGGHPPNWSHAASADNSIQSNNGKTEICKYFGLPGGCGRGDKCFYLHAKEGFQQQKQASDSAHSHAEQDSNRKIFVGGLPPNLDSDSLGMFFEGQFGLVDNAIVLGVKTGDKIHSRGFGFVTFKQKKSFLAAVGARYVTILGKQVEMKSAVPKFEFSSPTEPQKSPKQHEQGEGKIHSALKPQNVAGETTREMKEGQQRPCEKNRQEPLTDHLPSEKMDMEEAHRSRMMSWVDAVIQGQARQSRGSKTQAQAESTPIWLKTFRKWLPNFVKQISERGGGEYALSSLKADFRAAFGLDLDHASLGFPKLSDFMRTFPDICQTRFAPIGKQKTANHMILQPTAPSKHGYSNPHATPSSSQTSSSSSPPLDLDWIKVKHVCGNHKTSGGPSTAHSPSSMFLQSSLKPGPASQAQPWRSSYKRLQTGPSHPPDKGHSVLEALAKKKNNTSVYFLREFDFYNSYNASMLQGLCFGCNEQPVLWANFPCKHLLWCSGCKLQAEAAGCPDSEHKCVLCDVEVEKMEMIRSHKYNELVCAIDANSTTDYAP